MSVHRVPPPSRTVLALVGAVMLAACATLPASSAADTTRTLRFSPVGQGHVDTDGERFAVVQDPAGGVRLIDTLLGTVRQLARPPDCTFAAVGGGLVLWGCTSPNKPSPLLQDIRTGAIAPPRGLDALQRRTMSTEFHNLFDVGSAWIAGVYAGYHYSVPFYLNWRTGELRSGQTIGSARQAIDLDASRLLVRLCQPMRRTVDPAYLGSPHSDFQRFLPFEFRRPYGLALAQRSRGRPRLVLNRCGEAPRILSRGRYVFAMQLGGGVVTWSDGQRVHARFTDSRARRLGAPPAGRSLGGTIQHTRDRVYVEAYPPGGGTPDILVARIGR